MQSLYAVAFALPIYLMSGLPSASGTFILINMLGRFAATSCSELVSVFLSDAASANGAASSLMSFFTLFAGFVVKNDDLPSYWKWAYEASMLRYFYSPLVQGAAEKTSEVGKANLKTFSGLKFNAEIQFSIWQLCGYLILFRSFHAIFIGYLHSGASPRLKRLHYRVAVLCALVLCALWFVLPHVFHMWELPDLSPSGAQPSSNRSYTV